MRFKLRTAVLSFALAAAVSAPASAQDEAELKSQMQEKLEAKMAKPFASNAAWLTDYGKALAEAKASGKTIFTYFTRSYAP